MSGAISAVFQALCSPFSPLRRQNVGGNDDDDDGSSRGRDSNNSNDDNDGDGNSRGGDFSNNDSDNEDEVVTVVATGKKRKRRDKCTTTKWGTLTRATKRAMSDIELCQYFETSLQNIKECGNETCSCLQVLETAQIRLLVAKYLVWFERKPKQGQDTVLLDWYRYAHPGLGRTKWYFVPYMSDSVNITSDADRAIFELIGQAKVCSKGIQKIMFIGESRFSKLLNVSKTSGVMPAHKHTGRIAPNAVTDEKRTTALKNHFDALLCLGEVRATRVIATLVDGEQGHANREDTTDMVYLPISFGFRPCYKRYMEALGYEAVACPNGGMTVRGIGGKAIDHTEFVSFATYCRKWKKEYPQLRVSKPVEDICQYCFVFANRHRYLANHSSMELCVECDDDGDDIDVVRPGAVPLDASDDGGTGGGMHPERDINAEYINTTLSALGGAECASTTVAEERELLLLECALHVKMARAQRALYQTKIELAMRDAKAEIVHSKRTYTFVVDFGQNMELPVYNKQQPGCTYYYSPLSVYNLGMVNHGHKDVNGKVGAHMYAHVYHEGVGKKGANNVASLIVKTLKLLNLLQENSPGEELNIIFDNCSGQNKNNTVLKLAGWLKAMGYFKQVNFIFLIVGHTKNAADRLFNSLKHEYRKKNIYTMDSLVASLSKSKSVTVLPTEPGDFFNYDALFKDLFRNLSGAVKKNHIFSCTGVDRMDLYESNIAEHTKHTHKLSKKGRFMNGIELKEYSSAKLQNLECLGLNPYKMVELWKNYRPHVPKQYRKNELYQKPDAKVLALVKEERCERSVFRAKLKGAKAAGMKERLESIAYLDDDGNNIVMTDSGLEGNKDQESERSMAETRDVE